MTIREIIRSKRSREAVAKRLVAIANAAGCHAEQKNGGILGPRSILLDFITPAGALHIWLNGETTSGALLGHWHGLTEAVRPAMACAAGDMHSDHPSKCTTCSRDLDQFCDRVAAGLQLLVRSGGSHEE